MRGSGTAYWTLLTGWFPARFRCWCSSQLLVASSSDPWIACISRYRASGWRPCGADARYYRGVEWPDRIVIDPEILAGKPVIRGSRLAVEFILDLLAAGQPEADILSNCPGLTHDDIPACLAYASHLAHEYKAYPLPV